MLIAEKLKSIKKKENNTYVLSPLIAPPGNEPCEYLDVDTSRNLLYN